MLGLGFSSMSKSCVLVKHSVGASRSGKAQWCPEMFGYSTVQSCVVVQW